MKKWAALLSCSLTIMTLHAKSASESTAALGLEMLRATPSNSVISPFSAQSALAMAYAGAAGDTRDQMQKALGLEPESLEEFAGLLTSLPANLPEDFRLSIAARLFGQSGYPFLPDFLTLMADSFRAPLEEINFEAGPAQAAGRINAWVEEQTEGRIRDLIAEGALSKDTRLILVNSIYFLAPWAEPFPEQATQPGLFHLDAQESVEVPFMKQTGRKGYMRGENFTAVGIPYKGGEFEFVAILPDGDLREFEKALDAQTLLNIANLGAAEVRLSMPKFRIEPPRLALSDFLKSRGMTAAFDIPRGSADFSKMAIRKPDDYLFISEVFHKAFIEVNEAGTEAAAATAVIMMRATAIPAEPQLVELNRPFLFAIFHRPSSICLFLGRLVNPKG